MEVPKRPSIFSRTRSKVGGTPPFGVVGFGNSRVGRKYHRDVDDLVDLHNGVGQFDFFGVGDRVVVLYTVRLEARGSGVHHGKKDRQTRTTLDHCADDREEVLVVECTGGLDYLVHGTIVLGPIMFGPIIS